MKNLTLEACVDSYESAMAARDGGATCYELCANLIIGGTTPSPGLFKRIQAASDLPIRVLIRPRFGDFLYTEDEIEIMLDDIRLFRSLGAEGIVCGALTADGKLDREAMRRMREASGPLGFTLHRAFDVGVDASGMLEEAVDLGIDTILTSGQAPSALEGRKLLGKLHEQAAGRIEILVAAGVNAAVIEELYREERLRSFHLSGKEVLESGMKFRRKEVSMGLPGISEFEILRSSAANIRTARESLERLSQE